MKTNISVTSNRILIKLYLLDLSHQDESNGSIFIKFWLLVTEIFVFKVFVKLYIKLLTNQNCGLIAELRIIKVLRTLRIFRLKIRKWLQYLNLQLICNSELQVKMVPAIVFWNPQYYEFLIEIMICIRKSAIVRNSDWSIIL